MTKQILLIGDDPPVLRRIETALDAAGYHTSTLSYATYNPSAAHQVAAILVILDRTPLDDLTIWQTVQRMRLDRFMMHLPLIICTDLEPSLDETNFYAARHIIFVHKPFTEAELLRAVSAALSVTLPIVDAPIDANGYH